MKTQFHKTWLRPSFSIAGLAIAAAFAPTVVNAATLSLAPATQDTGVGDSFVLFVGIAGLGNHTAPSLGAFDLDVNFDSTLAQFNSISFGDPSLGDLLAPVTPSINGSALSISGDSLNLFSVSQDASADLATAQPDQFTLASLQFTALALGSGTFSFANIVLGDANGDPLALDAILGADVHIVPQGVPEALPAWAAVLAFGALAFAHNRLNRRQLVFLELKRPTEPKILIVRSRWARTPPD